jgi:hemerythrin-like domain-containing protein
MSTANQANAAAGMMRIHSVVTRALDVTMARGEMFAFQGFPDAATRGGYVSYVQCLLSFLNAHHLGEEEVAFPFFHERIPGAPYEEMVATHERMVLMLEQIKVDCAAVATEGNPTDALHVMQQTVGQLRSVWHPHIASEEQHFSVAVLASVATVDENLKLEQALAQHAQQHITPELVLPFMLYNMTPADRAVHMAGMPPLVTQQLVPIVWKDKWAPMKPFLLD